MKQGQKQGKQGRKSLKGTRGNVVGAPPKPVKWPAGKFSIASLISMNQNQCGLSLRNKVKASVINPEKGTGNPNGDLYQLHKQPNGKVGRPKAIFVSKENYDKTKMVLFQDAPAEPVKAPKTPRKAKVVAPSPVTPTVAPAVDATPTSVSVAEVQPAAPAAEAAPVVSTAVVETAPAVVA